MTSNLQTAFMRYTTPTERRITRALIRAALDKGWNVSAFDGEELTVQNVCTLTSVTDSLATTGQDTLIFTDANMKKIGEILLIWGNDEDVISDHTDNQRIRAIVAEAQG